MPCRTVPIGVPKASNNTPTAGSAQCILLCIFTFYQLEASGATHECFKTDIHIRMMTQFCLVLVVAMDVASLKIEGASTIHPVRKGFLDLAQPSAPEIAGRFGAAGTDIHWQFGGVGIGALALRVIVYVCTRMFVSASVHVGVTKCGRK